MLCTLSYLDRHQYLLFEEVLPVNGIEGEKGKDIRLELVPLLHARVSANRANIHHSVSKLHESASFLRQLDLRKVSESEVYQILVLVLAEPFNEAVAREWLAQSVCRQAVLSEAEVK
jgi:hypothetical protein